MKTDLLTCPICEKQFRTLNSHIHFKHKLTTEEFLRRYPDTKLVSDSIKEMVSNTCKKIGCGKWMKGYDFPEWRRKQYQQQFSGEKNPFFGKTHSKKTRKRMVNNHADFTGEKNPLVKWLKKDSKNRKAYSQRMKEAWKDPLKYDMMCKRNSNNVAKSILSGTHHPYSKCEHGWFESIKFSDRFYYQSSYERRFLEFCESFSKIISLQRVDFMIPYVDRSGKRRNYFPDFVVNERVVIEIKPKSMLDYNSNRQKIEAGKKFCAENKYEYKLLMEEELDNLDKIL